MDEGLLLVPVTTVTDMPLFTRSPILFGKEPNGTVASDSVELIINPRTDQSTSAME